MASRKVAVLDDYHGFSKPFFGKLGSLVEVSYFEDTLPPYNHPSATQSDKDKLAKRLEPFQIICTMRERTPFPAELIAQLPNLQVLLTTGLRNNGLDLPAFKARGIPVAGTAKRDPSEAAQAVDGPDSTTQHCVALILAIARGVSHDDAVVKTGGWQTSVATGLVGKTLGVVGLGRLGADVAKIMHTAFGMRVVAWSTNLTQDKADQQAQNVGLAVEDSAGQKTFRAVSKEELFSSADIVSVHVVLSERTRGLIAAQDLALMKPSAFFVNTSRGPLVVERHLLDVLEAGKIRGAATDVFDLEPLPADSPWRSTEWGKNGKSQVLVTPHMGYVEESIFNTWYQQQVDSIERWVSGQELSNRLV